MTREFVVVAQIKKTADKCISEHSVATSNKNFGCVTDERGGL